MKTNDTDTHIYFPKLFNEYFYKLVRFAQEYVLSKEDAENLIQDLFLQLYENRDTLQSVGNMHSYLYVLTKNRCIDYCRKELQRKQRSISLDQCNSMELQLKLDALTELDNNPLFIKEMEQLLIESINHLPEKRRHIFLLSRKKHLKHKEIADMLSLSVNTVQNQIGLAIRQIKEELKDYFYPPLIYFVTSFL